MIGDGFDFEKAYDEAMQDGWAVWGALSEDSQRARIALAKKFAAHVLREIADEHSIIHYDLLVYRYTCAAPTGVLRTFADELDSPEEEIKELKLEPGKYRVNGQVIEVKKCNQQQLTMN